MQEFTLVHLRFEFKGSKTTIGKTNSQNANEKSSNERKKRRKEKIENNFFHFLFLFPLVFPFTIISFVWLVYTKKETNTHTHKEAHGRAKIEN